jgi:hypothetical protein
MSFQQILETLCRHMLRGLVSIWRAPRGETGTRVDASSAAVPDSGIPPSEWVTLRKDAKRLLAEFGRTPPGIDSPLKFVQVGKARNENGTHRDRVPADLS